MHVPVHCESGSLKRKCEDDEPGAPLRRQKFHPTGLQEGCKRKEKGDLILRIQICRDNEYFDVYIHVNQQRHVFTMDGDVLGCKLPSIMWKMALESIETDNCLLRYTMSDDGEGGFQNPAHERIHDNILKSMEQKMEKKGKRLNPFDVFNVLIEQRMDMLFRKLIPSFYHIDYVDKARCQSADVSLFVQYKCPISSVSGLARRYITPFSEKKLRLH